MSCAILSSQSILRHLLRYRLHLLAWLEYDLRECGRDLDGLMNPLRPALLAAGLHVSKVLFKMESCTYGFGCINSRWPFLFRKYGFNCRPQNFHSLGSQECSMAILACKKVSLMSSMPWTLLAKVKRMACGRKALVRP